MKIVKLYSEKEYGQLLADFRDLEEIVLVMLMKKTLSIDKIPQHLRIRNSRFYIYAHRSCYYYNCENDFKTFYYMLKCLNNDIKEASKKECYSLALINRLKRLFDEYMEEAFSKGELKKYVLENAKQEGQIEIFTRSVTRGVI